MSVEDDVIVVTGASRGMGREMALRLSREGARVVLVARSREGLEEVAEEAEGEVLVEPTDVRDVDEVNSAVKAAVRRFGRVDALVNNAGISLLGRYDERRFVTQIDEDDWDAVTETNLKGVFLFSKAVLPHMDEGSNIVNVSSGLGKHAVAGASAYVASKWGLEGFTRSLALEHEDDGVNVNALSPGGQVNTRIWDHLSDSHRESILQPDVMNDAVVLLASQGTDGVTGESMTARDWEEELG